MLTILLIILLILLLAGGGWGYNAYGGWSFSPLAIVLIVLVVLYLVGVLRF